MVLSQLFFANFIFNFIIRDYCKLGNSCRVTDYPLDNDLNLTKAKRLQHCNVPQPKGGGGGGHIVLVRIPSASA